MEIPAKQVLHHLNLSRGNRAGFCTQNLVGQARTQRFVVSDFAGSHQESDAVGVRYSAANGGFCEIHGKQDRNYATQKSRLSVP